MKLISPYTTLNNVPNALVDDDDYEFLKKFRWNVKRKKAGAKDFYYCTRINGEKIGMAHLIIPEAIQIDHKNHDTCDNRKINLRSCTHTQNCQNRIKKIGKSKFKGVYWDKVKSKWKAIIKDKGKGISLGYFKSEKEAALAYDSKAKILWGAFSNTNF